MSYGWATVFTLAAWLVGLFLDGLLASGMFDLRILFPILVMGCCIMRFIKDNDAK